MKITLDWLKDRDACESQCELFADVYPDGVELTRVSLIEAANKGLQVSCLIKILPIKGPLLEEYRHKVDTLLEDLKKEYERQITMLWAEYRRKKDPFRTAYQRQADTLLEEYRDQEASLLVEHKHQIAQLLADALELP